MGLLVVPLLGLIVFALQVYSLIVATSALLTYMTLFKLPVAHLPALRTLGAFCFYVTEPVLAPLRRTLPFVYGIDLSPFVLILGGYFIQHVC